jgi:hypothetical protein
MYIYIYVVCNRVRVDLYYAYTFQVFHPQPILQNTADTSVAESSHMYRKDPAQSFSS